MTKVVLVHGAWCDGSSWSKVIPLLQDAGHDVVATQNPLTSLSDDVANLRKVLASLDGPVVLAGHCYGGCMISAAGLPGDVSALVYITAYAPDEGENVLGFTERFPRTAGAAAIRTPDDGYLTIQSSLYPEVIAGDVPARAGRVFAAVQKPTSGKCFGEPAEPSAWRSLPTW